MRGFAIELWALGRTDEALQSGASHTRARLHAAPYLAIQEADYLLRAEQFDAAIALYQYGIEADPVNANPYFGLADAKARQGRFDEAIRIRQKAHEAAGDIRIRQKADEVAGDDRLAAVFAGAAGETGYRRIEEAVVRLEIEALKEREKTKYVSPLDFARDYAQIGETELAFKYLDAAFDDRSSGLVFLKVDRVWDSVRNDPRFAAAIRRVGLP